MKYINVSVAGNGQQKLLIKFHATLLQATVAGNNVVTCMRALIHMMYTIVCLYYAIIAISVLHCVLAAPTLPVCFQVLHDKDVIYVINLCFDSSNIFCLLSSSSR